MPLDCPTVDTGEIYCIRERDFITQKDGLYVKLGKTSRDTKKRLKEHQTGNPRQEIAEAVEKTVMMSSLEKYLHYVFAEHCVNSEWFLIDQKTIGSKVVPLIQKLSKQHTTVRPLFDEWKKQSKTTSNGKSVTSTPAINKLHKDCLKKAEKYVVAEAKKQILELELKSMINGHDGIDNLIYLARSTPFDKVAFLKLLTTTEQNSCHNTSTKIGPSKPTISGTRGLLKAKDLTIYTALKATEKNYKITKPTDANLSKKPKKRLKVEEKIHTDWLKSKKEFKETQWEYQIAVAKLVEQLGDNEEIPGVIKWERVQKTSKSFDKKKAQKLFPAKFAACSGTPDSKLSKADIDDGKKYK